MSFDQVLGQPFAVNVLSATAKSGRLAPAYLFYGPPGCGKKAAARALAQALLCAEAPGRGCGDCPACRRVAQGQHPDCREVAPSGASFKVEQARELVREAQLRPYEGQRRLFIIDRAEAFTSEAANTLLKTLEEPPAGSSFILVSTQPARLLPTIASRCQSVRFLPLPDEALTTLLAKAHACEPARAREAGRLAGGDLRLAGRLLGPEGPELLAHAGGLLSAAASPSRLARLAWAQSASADKQDLAVVLDLAGVWLRELWVEHAGLPKDLRWLAELPEHGRGLPPQRIARLLQGLDRAREALRQNVNTALCLEILLLQD
jgi:DNA polymerase-3 subunit delta'